MGRQQNMFCVSWGGGSDQPHCFRTLLGARGQGALGTKSPSFAWKEGVMWTGYVGLNGSTKTRRRWSQQHGLSWQQLAVAVHAIQQPHIVVVSTRGATNNNIGWGVALTCGSYCRAVSCGGQTSAAPAIAYTCPASAQARCLHAPTQHVRCM